MGRWSESSRKHFDRIRALQFALDRYGAVIVVHQVEIRNLASFLLVIALDSHQVKFEWDGREMFLNVFRGESMERISPRDWTHVRNLRVASPASEWDMIEQTFAEEVAKVRDP